MPPVGEFPRHFHVKVMKPVYKLLSSHVTHVVGDMDVVLSEGWEAKLGPVDDLCKGITFIG